MALYQKAVIFISINLGAENSLSVCVNISHGNTCVAISIAC